MTDQDVIHDVLHGKLNKTRWTRPRLVKVFIASTRTGKTENETV